MSTFLVVVQSMAAHAGPIGHAILEAISPTEMSCDIIKKMRAPVDPAERRERITTLMACQSFEAQNPMMIVLESFGELPSLHPVAPRPHGLQKPVADPSNPDCQVQVGTASFYNAGAVTSDGEHFNPNAMTAAHRSLPMRAHVSVQDIKTGRTINVRINDRGPFKDGRIIDLTPADLAALGLSQRQGLFQVQVTYCPVKRVAELP